MELRNLRTFIRAAELNSFSGAAARLGYAQSTVTAQIAALENELGTALFVRNGKRIVLSGAGRELLHYAYQMRFLDEKVHDCFAGSGEPEGFVHVGMLESLSASDYVRGIAAFLRHCPAVRLKVTVATTLQLQEMLRRGEVDVIVLLDRPVIDPLFRTLYETPAPVLFFASACGPYQSREPVKLESLMEEDWLLTEKGCNYRQILEEELAARRLTMRDRLEIGSTAAIIQFAAEGLGISLLPEFDLQSALKQKIIVPISVSDYQMTLKIQILVSNEQWISPAVRRFCEEFSRVLTPETDSGC